MYKCTKRILKGNAKVEFQVKDEKVPRLGEVNKELMRSSSLGPDAEEELFDVAVNFLEVLILELFQFSDITVFGADKSEENSK